MKHAIIWTTIVALGAAGCGDVNHVDPESEAYELTGSRCPQEEPVGEIGDGLCFDTLGPAHSESNCYRGISGTATQGLQCCYHKETGKLEELRDCWGPAEGEEEDGTCDWAFHLMCMHIATLWRDPFLTPEPQPEAGGKPEGGNKPGPKP